MSNIDIIRAWKDEEYRNSLSEEQRSQLPENPAGMIELSDEDSEALVGGGQYLAIEGRELMKAQTVTVSIDVCCSTGDLPCTNNTQDLLCLVAK